MLDTYDFQGDVWLCHSSGGQCYDFTAFVCALGPPLKSFMFGTRGRECDEKNSNIPFYSFLFFLHPNIR
jgi:hypothetical protein